MASSTTHIDTISSGQAGKEVTANAFFDAASPATLYGRRAETCGGLTFGYYGGVVRVAGVATVVANGTVSVPASSTRYIEADPATGAVAIVSSFTAGKIPLYTVVSDSSTVTSYTDHRAFAIQAGYASAAQAEVTSTAGASYTAAEQVMLGELKTLANALRDALVRTGIIKGGA